MIKQENQNDVLLRGEKAEDFKDIDEINKKAFGTDTEARLVESLRKTRNYAKGLSIVLLLGGKVIGHLMMTHARITNRGRRFNCLALGPMSVLPEFQRRGYGTMLAEEAILRAKECGFKAIVVLGHTNFYPRFGFIPASTKNIRSRFSTGENFMVLELVPNALKGISGLAEYAREFSTLLNKQEPAKNDEPVKIDDDGKNSESSAQGDKKEPESRNEG